MVTVIADNIVSPLGTTSAATYASVKAGRSQLCRYEGRWGMPEQAVLSLLPDDMIDSLAPEASQGELLTRFERMCIASAGQAIEKAGIDAASPRVVFVLSTTLTAERRITHVRGSILARRQGWCRAILATRMNP